MDSKSISFNILKKNRISILAVMAFAVAFCCIFAFAGNKAEPADNVSSVEESVTSSESVEKTVSVEVSESENLAGYGIYIDGCFLAAVSDSSIADAAFEELLASRVASLNVDAAAENSFSNDVEYIEGEYPSETFLDKSGVSALISDSVSDYNGELLPVKLSVTSVVTYTETVVLEYETKTVYTDALRDGVTKVVEKGYNGEGEETKQIISVDGVETETNVVSLEVTSEAVDEVVRVGTRSDGINTASVMNFIKPYDGVITYYCGPRWGTTHKGLDIAQHGGCYRDPAVAAADGVVIQASNTGNGYGNCVILDHGNGITTLYAHFDEVTVEVGQTVKAGEVVGLIGNTGYSFGNHLHFEVRINGEFVNPLLFVDYE